MNGRAGWVILGIVGLATASCSKGTNSDDRAATTKIRSADVSFPAMSCTLEPWVGGSAPCKETATSEHRAVTCAALGFSTGVTLTPGAPDSAGRRYATHAD